MDKKNKSKLEEAILDIKKIMESSSANAKKKISEELEEKFSKLLSEATNKNKKESVKESAKDEKKKEPINEGKKKNTDDKKESVNESESHDMTNMSLDDVEEAYDTATEEDEFEVLDDDIDMDEIEKELNQMGEMADTMDEMGNEENMDDVQEGTDDPYEIKLRKIHTMLSEMMDEMDSEKKNKMYTETFDKQMREMYGESYKDMMGEEKYNEMYEMYKSAKANGEEKEEVSEMHEKGPDSKTIDKMHKGDLSPSTIKEDDHEEKDHDGEEMEKDDEVHEEMDETHGVSYAAGKQITGTLPNQGAEYRDRPGHSRNRPQWSNEGEEKLKKRIDSLLKENKEKSKQLTKTKSELDKRTGIIKEQNSVLLDYKTQLQEMAVFNTNIAYVNSLLLNESLALTSDDKEVIINKFKKIDNINESEETYKSILSEMSKSKKTLSEDVEDEVSKKSVSSSASSKKLVEQVSEKTGYSMNEHLSRILKTMNYVDNHGTKKVLK